MDYKTSLATAGIIGISAFTFGRKYLAGGVCSIVRDLTGQVVIITGSNTGIGKETARVLAQMGASVILACRDAKKTLIVVDELKKDTKSDNIEFIRLDLTDMQSIREFVEEFKSKYQKLNILINNAGIMAVPDRKTTKDGFELQFGTNHLGHFYLTTLLLDTIKKSENSRIINVSSVTSYYGRMNWDDLMLEKSYNMMRAYSQSKLANVIFTKELQRRLQDSKVKVFAVHPGVVKTDITRHVVERWYFRLFFSVLGHSVMKITGKSTLQGAQTTLYCALEDFEKIKGGAYYSDCKMVKENPEANKEENWKKLWDASEKFIAEKLPN